MARARVRGYIWSVVRGGVGNGVGDGVWGVGGGAGEGWIMGGRSDRVGWIVRVGDGVGVDCGWGREWGGGWIVGTCNGR